MRMVRIVGGVMIAQTDGMDAIVQTAVATICVVVKVYAPATKNAVVTGEIKIA